jgi:hypothetical protein
VGLKAHSPRLKSGASYELLVAAGFPGAGGAIEGLKRVGAPRKRNRRSLHCAPPDFLSRTVALIDSVRLSLRRAAYVVVAEIAK